MRRAGRNHQVSGLRAVVDNRRGRTPRSAAQGPPRRSSADLTIDGGMRTTLDIAGLAHVRQQSSADLTIKVVVGTSGRPRVDVDAFAVLR